MIGKRLFEPYLIWCHHTKSIPKHHSNSMIVKSWLTVNTGYVVLLSYEVLEHIESANYEVNKIRHDEYFRDIY